MSRRFSPKFKAEALRLLSVGVSTYEAQAQLKRRFRTHVGEGTLRKWKKDAESAPDPDVVIDEAEHTPPAEAPPVASTSNEIALPPGEGTTYERVSRALVDTRRRADEASRDGNHTAAQRFSKQALDYELLLARLEKQRDASVDGVTIPRAELERIRQDMLNRVAALAADLERTGGLVCSKCGRELRIEIARGTPAREGES